MDATDDKWDDEQFLDELFCFHDVAVASRNPNPTPAPVPQDAIVASYPSCASTLPISYIPTGPHASAPFAFPLSHIAAAPHGQAFASADVRLSSPRELSQLVPALGPAASRVFSPPRELSQLPPVEVAEDPDCRIVRAVGRAGGDRVRGVGVRRERDAREAERERRDVERLKRELSILSKQMNDLTMR